MNFTTYGLSPVAPGIQPISSVLNVKFQIHSSTNSAVGHAFMRDHLGGCPPLKNPKKSTARSSAVPTVKGSGEGRQPFARAPGGGAATAGGLR